MTPSRLSARVVSERVAWVQRMTAGICALPLTSFEAFMADPHVAPAAESYLRRALEALLDLGRHLLAKGFGQSAAEYREIALQLERVGVLQENDARLLGILAGYRNRLVHFYSEVGAQELYEICSQRMGDVDRVLDALRAWIAAHPDRLDQSL